jgi:uncharacterized membrane protein YeaQ/YmgE (transglycosylase-associated protein family)
MAFLWFVVMGAAAGWLAGRIMKGYGYGFVGDNVIAFLGALVLIFVVRIFTGRRARIRDGREWS